MSKKNDFVNYVEELIQNAGDAIKPNENAISYWNAFKIIEEKEKPIFTDNGKLVMKYLQSLPENTSALKARDIAEKMFISSRTVSGCMRKLVADGYISKMNEDPVYYELTEKGKKVEIL